MADSMSWQCPDQAPQMFGVKNNTTFNFFLSISSFTPICSFFNKVFHRSVSARSLKIHCSLLTQVSVHFTGVVVFSKNYCLLFSFIQVLTYVIVYIHYAALLCYFVACKHEKISLVVLCKRTNGDNMHFLSKVVGFSCQQQYSSPVILSCFILIMVSYHGRVFPGSEWTLGTGWLKTTVSMVVPNTGLGNNLGHGYSTYSPMHFPTFLCDVAYLHWFLNIVLPFEYKNAMDLCIMRKYNVQM